MYFDLCFCSSIIHFVKIACIQFKLRPVLCLAAISIFVDFALASEFLDESSNTVIELDECQSTTAVSGQLVVKIQYVEDPADGGHGIEDIPGTIFITHQAITDSITCAFDADSCLSLRLSLRL